MARMNNGTVKERNGLYFGRVRWTEDGKARDYKLAPQKTESLAWKAVHKKKKKLERKGASSLDPDRVSFSDLARLFREARLYKAKIVDGKKVGGVKSLQPMLCSLNALTEYFGSKKVLRIRHSDLEKYKQSRLDTPTIHGKQRKISSVNRELELARSMFRFAMQERLLTISPFTGSAIIARSAEISRDRILTDHEEFELLESCRKADKNGRYRRLQLVPLIIAAVDTAARRGELFSLTWRDVDFQVPPFGAITIRSSKSKTERKRVIGMTKRLKRELLGIWENRPEHNPDDLVLGYKSTPKTAFMSACIDAGITDLRFHDLRHTATTRMMEAVPNAELVKKITGHTQHSTFERYYNPNTDTITSVADALGRRNDKNRHRK